MSVAKVLRLDEYRDRRTHRLRLAEALHSVEPYRHAVFSHLVEIADLSGADRVATVWVDEYGSGLIHPYLVLDALCDRPRRQFSNEPLLAAWELGVPSALDGPPAFGTAAPATLAIALGSDGTRAWFVLAESIFARPALEAGVRDRIMFLAGECASVVLHRDLDALVRRGGASRASGFAGWPVLEDLDGHEEDEVTSARIARRFVVARLVRMLVDDDLVIAPERMADQVRRARSEIGASPAIAGEADEERKWHAVLEALEAGAHERLAHELVELGDIVEGQGHTKGALELYRCAQSTAVALGAPTHAADAALLTGRLLRRQADWEGARRAFEHARDIASVAGLPAIAVRALVGLSGIKKEIGNLPAAREVARAALGVASDSGERDSIALAHHTLLGIEQVAGNLEEGLRHGWIAVATYGNPDGRMRCLAGLAGVLTDYGDREAAEDAWSVVAHSTTDRYYRIYAHDALGYLAALRGDRREFEQQTRLCDALGWETGMPSAKAEILYYRGLSCRALGLDELARRWLDRAVAFAEDNQFNRVAFKADEARAELLDSKRPAAVEGAAEHAAPREVRDGLRAMRHEMVGAGA